MSCLKNTSPLSLDHQAALSALWRPLCVSNNLQFAEYSYANAFLFRRQHHFTFIDCDPPHVRGEFQSGQSYYIPTCLPRECFSETIRKCVDGPVTLFPIPESWLADFTTHHPKIQSCRQDSDYLFRTEKLKTLSGRALSSRRNLLHQFESHHVAESKPFTAASVEDALKVLEEWQENSQLPKEKTDYFSCRDAFDHFTRLELTGRIAYAEGIPVGFAIGELLTPKTAVLHLLKSIRSYKGVTPFLYRDFVTHLPEGVEWINLEQDLGIPSLRAAKEAYEPDLLLPKYRVTV